MAPLIILTVVTLVGRLFRDWPTALRGGLAAMFTTTGRRTSSACGPSS